MKKVCAVVIINNGKVLLIRRDFNKSFGGRWEVPGGKVEQGESSLEAAIREVKEETGIKLNKVNEFKQYTGSETGSEITAFYVQTSDTNIKLNKGEHIEYGWFKPEEIFKLDIWKDNTSVISEVFKNELGTKI